MFLGLFFAILANVLFILAPVVLAILFGQATYVRSLPMSILALFGAVVTIIAAVAWGATTWRLDNPGTGMAWFGVVVFWLVGCLVGFFNRSKEVRYDVGAWLRTWE